MLGRVMDAAGGMELSSLECLARLRSADWGRAATSIQTIAMVVPVPIRVLEDRVVFATGRGSIFDRAVHGQAVSVQAEGLDAGDGATASLWSVVVSGICVAEPGHDASLLRLAAIGGWRGEGFRLNSVPFSRVQGWSAPLPLQVAPAGAGG